VSENDIPLPAVPDAEDTSRRSGMVAVVGRANVGKSSLTNKLLGEKLSIVSPVAQTTRNAIRGILTEPRGQLVLVDTPGMHKAPGDLGRMMNRMARSSIDGVDAVLLVLDAAAPLRDEDEGWMRRLVKQPLPVVIALNKADISTRTEAELRAFWKRAAEEAVASALVESVPEPVWLAVSAVTGDGVAVLTDLLFGLLPYGPLLFPEDILSDYPRKLNIADVIREKLFFELREELPHAIAVWVDKLDDSGPDWTARVVIYVNKYSQKGIVIGEKGRLLRKVRRAAETELADIYERNVTLDLWVKVEPNWGRNFWLLKQFGYAG
jgi:GTP-binding protein Era